MVAKKSPGEEPQKKKNFEKDNNLLIGNVELGLLARNLYIRDVTMRKFPWKFLKNL